MALDGAVSRGSAVTVTTGDAYIPELWAPELLKQRDKATVMVSHIMHVRPEGLKKGDTVNIPWLTNETALDKTAESAITFSSNTEGKVTLKIDKYKYVGKLIEDIVEVQSNYDLFTNYRDKIANALAQVVDTDVLALTMGVAQSAGTWAAGSISKNAILTGIRMLDAAEVPQEDRFLVVDAFGREDLFLIDDFVRYDAGGVKPSAIKTGEIGEIYGLKVLFSNNLMQPTATSAVGMIFHKDAFAIALQKDVSVKTEYSVDYIGMKMVGYNIYGVTIARTDHVALLRYTRS
ncbi:MAG: hypothetical protein H0U60_20035 [Blastocatellia bacterium]|nr:hypothetical protein [Blastocatellia bacterium]